jgi:hypothetical protein
MRKDSDGVRYCEAFPSFQEQAVKSYGENVVFLGTEEIRQPKTGEWYLNVNGGGAMLAQNDMSGVFRILKPGYIETRTQVFPYPF